MRTRSNITSLKEDGPTMASGLQAYEPLKLLILPKGTSSNARICTLTHPRTGKPSRYYLCPEKGISEFTRVATPKSACHSWLIGRHSRSGISTKALAGGKAIEPYECSSALKEEGNEIVSAADGGVREFTPVSEGYVVKTPELLVATPIDPLFVLLPSLQSKRLFLSIDDIFDDVCDTSKHFRHMSNHERTRGLLEERLDKVCDMVETGDESMYRLNTEKLLKELLIKAKAMVALGLPKSMEERYIRKALETPVMGLRREQSSSSDAVGASQDEAAVLTPIPSEATKSQLSTTTSQSTASNSSAQTEITVPNEDSVTTVSNDIKHLLRIRTALSYIISAYIPSSLGSILNDQLCSVSSPINFKTLEEHLAHIAKMRTEVLASRSLSDFSRKRSMNDDEAAETRAEKKRRKEEEEKRKKAGESRGLRDLKKVNVTGMKKMSDFFGKGAVTKTK